MASIYWRVYGVGNSGVARVNVSGGSVTVQMNPDERLAADRGIGGPQTSSCAGRSASDG